MTRRKALLIAFATLALALLVVPEALASAGGGSAGFSGGGGEGGGGGGSGKGFALFILVRLLIDIALIGHGLGLLFLIGLALIYLFFTRFMPYARQAWENRSNTGRNSRRRVSQRQRRVQLAAAEAAEDDPAFAPENVLATAKQLFFDIEAAWDANDRLALRRLVAPDLLNEWERRLDDFQRRGWRNHVEPLGEPGIEYVGLHHKGDPDTDRVTVRIQARLKDYVIDSRGRHLKRSGRLGETTRMREYWTLARRGERWVLQSIEQGAEGSHALEEQVVATPWADERGLRDEALIEGAVADGVPKGTTVAEVADLQFEGDAHSAANDLSLADGRFAPDVLEIAARRAVDAWAQAVDGDDGQLRKIATPQATHELLYPAGDRTRLVVRGPQVNRIRIVGLDAATEPPTMTVEVDLTGRRYVEDRDTTAVVAGSRSRAANFTERWTLTLNDDPKQPWRITSVGSPVGLA
jgi:predicted lipid-binding transport protein (Tim44 family)